MATYWSDLFSYVAGAIRTRDAVYLVIAPDDCLEANLPVSDVVQYQPGGWADGGRMEWRTASVALARHPLVQCIVAGEHGAALLAGSGDRHEEVIASPDSPDDRGPLRGVRCIGNEIVVVGMDRQVYLREGEY